MMEFVRYKRGNWWWLMIHEWEENRAKGKREEERVWESGDGGGE